ncbi:MAG: DUF2269 family protein [Actinobacteria bacterium]|jgi:uncharacterized membrane protein|nr:MAG: DUF2269 family protein [Actinomycetota bacterium]
MSLYQWLLFFHVTGAFFLIGGIVIAGILNIAAIAKDRRPSEIAALYGLIRFAVPLIGAGLLLTLAIGLWLVNEVGYGYGETWIVTAIALWVLASALGNIDGKYQRQTGELARRLAAEGDAPSSELRARLRNPSALAISYGSGLMAFAVLGIMIWKPGV